MFALTDLPDLFEKEDFNCFQRQYGHLKVSSRTYQGVGPIDIDKVVGTVGRCQQQENFEELKKTNRYHRIKEAIKNQEQFPAIKVYKAGDEYYIVDGHHRVMAARELGRKFIDAEVTEYKFSGPKDEKYHGCDRSSYRTCVVKGDRTNLERRLDGIKYKYKKMLARLRKINRLMPYEEVIDAWYETDLLPFVKKDDKQM